MSHFCTFGVQSHSSTWELDIPKFLTPGATVVCSFHSFKKSVSTDLLRSAGAAVLRDQATVATRTFLPAERKHVMEIKLAFLAWISEMQSFNINLTNGMPPRDQGS